MPKHDLKKSLAEALEIPDEVAMGSPRMVIVGTRQLSVENHHGLIEYAPGKIVFKTAVGRAEVLGEGLSLATLSTDTLSIEGDILAVCLNREGDGA